MRSRLARLAPILLPASVGVAACSSDWPSYRHDNHRSASQPAITALSDPSKIQTLHVRATYPPANEPPMDSAFASAPIVWKDRVFVGNSDGYFRALDADTLRLLWQFPARGDQPLVSGFPDFRTADRGVNPSGIGIAGGATMARINQRDAVIFGAPDRCPDALARRPSACTDTGSGYLFAVDARTGDLLWRSDAIAIVDSFGYGQRHAQIGYSAPLVADDKVYVGVSDHVDNPVQDGQVVAVTLNAGTKIPGFSFHSVGGNQGCGTYATGCGGDVWSSVAFDHDALYVATGNVRPPFGGAVDYGHALVKLDASHGDVVAAPPWPYQPSADLNDDDWAATPSVMDASCGKLVVSTQKDGFTHAVPADAAAGTGRGWVFPANTPMSGDGSPGYAAPGAAWGDVYYVVDGGNDLATQSGQGQKRITALNACTGDRERVRWMLDYPPFKNCDDEKCGFGPPSVSHGVVYVGTRSGHLLAIEDPRVAPGKVTGWRCDDPTLPAFLCTGIRICAPPLHPVCHNVSIGRLVPIPFYVDVDLKLNDLLVSNTITNELISAIVAEPALAHGRVYIAAGSHAVTGGFTSAPGCATPGVDPTNCTKGRLLMLEP
jgi:outer membrane protein assembly factor BamB